MREPLVPRTGNPRFQDWEALVRTFEKRQCPELGTYAPMTSNSWEWQFYKAIFFSSFDDAYFLFLDAGLVFESVASAARERPFLAGKLAKKNAGLVSTCHMFSERTPIFLGTYM